METYSIHIPPARKLKDSCDLCSASKLRCDKQKPTCTRCATLSRPCSYSPARRAGRPHRVRRERSQSHQQCFGTPGTNSRGGSGIGSSHLMEPARDSGQSSEASCDNGPSPGVHTREHEQNNQQEPAGASASPCAGPDPDTGETDCTKAAISIVEQLDAARRRSAPMYGSLTATEACQRLLTILMCPCSEQPGVALLVASGCISLMDMIHHHADSHLDQGVASLELSTTDGTSISPGSGQDVPMWPPQSSSRSLSSHGQSQVGDLSKVAKVILQFTDRYGQDTKGGARWEHTLWVVAPIAVLLRFRLQSATHGAARRLVF